MMFSHLLVCLSASKITQKVLDQLSWNLSRVYTRYMIIGYKYRGQATCIRIIQVDTCRRNAALPLTTKCWKDYCSGRSPNTKPSCNKTELNGNSETEMRWNKKEVSLSSPELREILRPRSERNWRASLFMGPRDSKAIGWKQYWLSSFQCAVGYLAVLRVAAISATAPADPIAVWSIIIIIIIIISVRKNVMYASQYRGISFDF